MSLNQFFPTVQRRALYEGVKDEITRRIHQGMWGAGTMIPNEIELAKLFQVSQGTVRRALHELVEAGLLIRRQGKGTFVNDYGHNRAFTDKQFVRVRPDANGIWRCRSRLVLFEETADSKTAWHCAEFTGDSYSSRTDDIRGRCGQRDEGVGRRI